MLILQIFSEVKRLDVTIPLTDVPTDDTTYSCMVMDVPQGHDMDFHIIATSPKIDNIDLVHHAKIFGCPDDGKFACLYSCIDVVSV